MSNEISSKRVAVTGASGFIGVHLLHGLHAAGAEVVAIVLGDLDCTIYESYSHAGGHASSFRTENGFIFDEGPHVSFTPHERTQTIVTFGPVFRRASVSA